MLIKESESDEAKMSFGINEISMSWSGMVLPCRAWPGLAWPGLALLCSSHALGLLNLTLFAIAWLGPKAECVKLRIGLDTGDHVSLLLRFVLLALTITVLDIWLFGGSPVCSFFLFLILRLSLFMD